MISLSRLTTRFAVLLGGPSRTFPASPRRRDLRGLSARALRDIGIDEAGAASLSRPAQPVIDEFGRPIP